MPSFEDSENSQSNKETYTPSTDAKPRTRRRSGGFKTEHAPVQSGIGEVDPKDALKGEKLSGRPEPEIKKLVKKVAKKDSPRPAAKKEQAEEPKTAPKESTSKADPSPETLAAIQRVEGRIAERRKERDAKRAEREKNRPEKTVKKAPARKQPTKKSAKKGKKNKGGLISSILKFFGLGPKGPVKKSRGPKHEGGGNRGKGSNRPQGKGGNNRGGKGRRRGGKGSRQGGRRNNESVS